MNTFKLSLLLLALIAVLNLQQPEHQKVLKKIELIDQMAIEYNGDLVIPTIIKSDAPVVHTNDRNGVVVLRIKGMRFIYEKADTIRNEYVLKTKRLEEISIAKGDEVEVDFRQAFMEKAEAIPAHIKVLK
jgi:hypothetical protein